MVTQLRRITKISIITILALAAFFAFSATAHAAAGSGSYVVVASETTYDQPDWQKVITTLREKHNASLVIYRNSIQDTLSTLAGYMPQYICFVEPADNADRSFVVDVQRLTRKLDTDPYTDSQWAILTGYTPEDALRIASCDEPLTVDKVFSGTVSIDLNNVSEGYQFNEGKAGEYVKKTITGGQQTIIGPDDSTETIVNAMQDNVDAMFTSGHGMTNGWQIGFNYTDGFIRGAEGQLYGYDTKGNRTDFTTNNPKVYLPCGNCLIGLIPKRDCFATAMMHTGGVNQMFGYIVVTFYGYMGWGINSYFGGMPGHYTLNEAFYANQQSLLYEMGERFPKLQTAEFSRYEYQDIYNIAVKDYAGNDENNAVGMLWDRDAIAFYGDPAWPARVKKGELPWTDKLTKTDSDKWLLEITTAKDGNWPDRPLFYFLPQRLQGIKITSGDNYAPAIADNFIMLPLKGKFTKDTNIKIEFTGTPTQTTPTSSIAKPVYVGVSTIDQNKGIISKLPAEYKQLVCDSLLKAGKNAGELAKVLNGVAPNHLEAAAFLIAYMPKSDLKTISSDLLLDNIKYAYQAAEATKWQGIDKATFFNDVLPYACLDEVRVNWRKDLMDKFLPLVKDCKTPSEAAQMLNKELWDIVNVKYSTEREKPNQNPFESMASGIASCSGLSILLADACRSVGVPARVAGIVKWPHKDGNHNWVEIWDDKWYVLGAWDGEDLDKVWFGPDVARAEKGSRYHGIFASSYKPTGSTYLCVWAPENCEIPSVEVTDRYLDIWKIKNIECETAFRVYDTDGKRIAANIKISRNSENTTMCQCGISKDETRDTNDTTSFKLIPGEKYTVEITYNDKTKTIEYTPESQLFNTMDITLE